MIFDKFEKTVILILSMALLTMAGGYARRSDILLNPELLVGDRHTEYIEVSVNGAVEKPGKYTVEKGSTVGELAYIAGGVTKDALTKTVDFEAELTDGMRVMIPGEGKNDETFKININTADEKALCLIPGIGETIAGRIVEYRMENGAFKIPADIMNVKGIGEKTFEKFREYIITEETQK